MKILITGFGPYDLGFDRVEENASWEAVKRMKKEEIESKYGINIIVEYMSVDYNKVQKKISELWSENQHFDLVVHVGLEKQTQCLKLENQACKGNYNVSDCQGCVPKGGQHPSDGMEVYITALNVEAIVEEFNAESPEQLTAEISEEAGKYLCEYIYYTSLHHSETKKVLFVHVPHEKYSHEQLARGLETLLEILIKHCQIS